MTISNREITQISGRYQIEKILDLHQIDHESRDRGCLCGKWSWHYGTTHSEHVARELLRDRAFVAVPDPQLPTPALIEAAYVLQDDLTKPPDKWVIHYAAETIEAYLLAQVNVRMSEASTFTRRIIENRRRRNGR